MCISCHALSFFWTLPPSLYWSRYMLGKNLHVYWHKINSWELTYPLPRHKCIKNMWRLRLHRNGSMILKFVIILDGWKRYLEQWHSKSIIYVYIYICALCPKRRLLDTRVSTRVSIYCFTLQVVPRCIGAQGVDLKISAPVPWYERLYRPCFPIETNEFWVLVWLMFLLFFVLGGPRLYKTFPCVEVHHHPSLEGHFVWCCSQMLREISEWEDVCVVRCCTLRACRFENWLELICIYHLCRKGTNLWKHPKQYQCCARVQRVEELPRHPWNFRSGVNRNKGQHETGKSHRVVGKKCEQCGKTVIDHAYCNIIWVWPK